VTLCGWVFRNVAKKTRFFETTGTTHKKTQVYLPEDLKSQRHIYEDPKPRNYNDAIKCHIYIYTYICVYIYIYVCVCVCVCVYNR